MTTASTLALMIGAATGLVAQTSPPRTVTLAAPSATLAAELTLVTSVRELPDGRVLVVDRPEKKLLVADWASRTVSGVGRAGSGPGEYLQPGALLAIGRDSTLMPDLQNGRWLLLRGASIAGTVGADAPAISSGARQPLGADFQGHVIATRPLGAGRQAPGIMPRLDSTMLLRIDRANGRADTLEALKARPTTIKTEGPANRPTSVNILVNPLAAGELAALFPDGWIAVARLNPYRVVWIAPDGKQVRGSALPFERVPLTEREQRAYMERQAARTGNPSREPKSMPDWPDIMPPFLQESLLPAPDGRLWIRRPPTTANPNPSYDVIDRRGALVARVTTDPNVQVVGFGPAAVYTVLIDDNGIEQLQRRAFPKL